MPAEIIDGKQIAAEFKKEMARQVEEIKQKYQLVPTLVVILVGNDPASEVYVNNKKRAAHLIGMNSIQYELSANTSEADLIAKIKELNTDPKVHGILVQLPLPKHIDTKKVIYTIDPGKDVDGFNIINVGKLSIGELGGNEGAIVPCTPLACVHLLKSAVKGDLAGLKVLVIGSSNIVGRPLARLLMLESCTVTVANRSTRDLKAECLVSDVIIPAAGVPNLIKEDMVKMGAIVIDVGINRITTSDGQSRLVGDVDFEGVKKKAKAITPVPGGVGPMTIAYLLKNTLDLCKRAMSNQATKNKKS